MIVGCAILTIHIPAALSLKEKRSVLQSVLKRVSNTFNASIAEIGDHDLWQRSTVGLAVIGSSTVFVEKQVQTIIRFIEGEPRLELCNIDLEWR